MITRTIYIAVDGNEFDDQYKCQEYEKEILALRQQVSTIRFFDKNKNWLTVPYIFEKKFEDILDNIYDDCMYIEITSPLSHEVQNYIIEIFSWEIPFTKGTYKYDWDNGEWVRET